MPSTFDDLIAEAREAGVRADWIERLQKANDASPLRREREEAIQRAQAAEEEAKALRGSVLSSTWKEIGAKGNPDHIAFPPDLKVTDREALTEWAVQAGFAEARPDAPPETLQAHERIARASTDGAAEGGVDILAELDPRKLTEDEFFARASALGRTST